MKLIRNKVILFSSEEDQVSFTNAEGFNLYSINIKFIFKLAQEISIILPLQESIIYSVFKVDSCIKLKY